MKIKLICSDIDGTLTKNFSFKYDFFADKTIASIRSFVQNGGIFVLATGRSLPRLKLLANDLENKLNCKCIPYLISLNGAIIFDNKEKKVLESVSFSKDVYNQIFSFLKDNKLDYFVVTDHNNLCFPNKLILKIAAYWWFKNYPKKYCSDMSSFSNLQKIVVFSRKRQAKKLKAIIESKFTDVYVSCFGPFILEIIDNSINKFLALEKVLELCNVKVSETCAIGNEGNDIMMIEKSGFGVAVDFKDNPHLIYDEGKVQLHVKNKSGLAVHNAIQKLKEMKYC